MKKTVSALGLVVLITAVLLSACGGGKSESANTPAPTADRPAPPADYAGKTNPHAGDQTAADAGKGIFTTNCSSCHGESGKGDGPAAASLTPRPQNLAENETGVSDAYLFWRINEGGAMAPFNSAMPAWKGVLTEDQIWQAITYIRTLGK